MPAIIDKKSGECIDISKYVKAADLKGREVAVTIERVECEMLSLPGQKPSECAVAYFVGANKPMILNTTNLRSIRNLHGTKVSAWADKKITLFPTFTKLRGSSVPCIRIKGVAGAGPDEIDDNGEDRT